MSARGDKSIDEVAQEVTDLMPELEPRIISPSLYTQQELSIEGDMMLARVGQHRVVAVAVSNRGAWSLKEFDTTSGDLDVVWSEDGDVSDEQIPTLVLAAAIGSLQEQLGWTGGTAIDKHIRPALTGLLETLRSRQQQLANADA